MKIDSRQNPKVKYWISLREAAGRKEAGSFLIDTPRDQLRALEAPVEIVTALVCEAYPRPAEVMEALKQKKVPCVELGRAAFEAVSYRENPTGVILEAKMWAVGLELWRGPVSLVVLLEDVEKPGNLGTLLRTADAVGADGVIGCGQTVELFNPNTLRASAGAVFRVPYAAATTTQALAWLKEKGVTLVATSPAAQKTLWEADLTGPVALALGSEDRGLSPELLKAAELNVKLPMAGAGDSLNVSAAAAAVLYEVCRQRRQKQG